MTSWDLLLTDARIATMAPAADGYGTIEKGAIAIAGGRLAWVGPADELPRGEATERRSLDGRWVTPALIDCHTHAVFAGDRAREFERRASGASYAEIAASGGGIAATVGATRAASVADLVAATVPRLRALRAGGVATVEIKSGYGLELDSELRMLEAARQAGEAVSMRVVTTFLGAHAVPPEYRDRADAYIDALIAEALPAVAESGLADAVDAYCEHLAFSPDQVDRLFARAGALALPVKLHADQLSDTGGAALAARHRALSADHLEYSSPDGIAALGAAGCVAVLLPGAFLTLRERTVPPVAGLRDAGVPIAVATDLNPGTSPLASLRLAMSLAVHLFALTPGECLAGVTRNAARALGRQDELGTLEPGKLADLAIWDIGHPRDLVYWMGDNPLEDLLIGGASN